MTTILAGINIARTVYDAARQAGLGFDLTLTVVDKGRVDPNNYTAGKQKTETPHPGYGIVEVGVRRIGGTIIQTDTATITIYAASLPPGVVPKANDRVEIKGETYTIASIEIDPADATYTCITEA